MSWKSEFTWPDIIYLAVILLAIGLIYWAASSLVLFGIKENKRLEVRRHQQELVNSKNAAIVDSLRWRKKFNLK